MNYETYIKEGQHLTTYMHNIHIHTYTHTQAHTDTIHQIKINCIVIHLFTSQVMDSQANSETFNNLLENDMISLSGGESDIDLLGSDPDTNSQEDMCTTKHFSIFTIPLTPLRPPHPPQSPNHYPA